MDQSATENIIISQDLIEQLKTILYPETLENSKLIGLISEDLHIKLDDLHNFKDVKVLFQSKEHLLKALESVPYYQFNEKKDEIFLNVNDDFTIYSLLNVPSKFNKDDLIKSFNFDETKFERIYKKYFIWLLVTKAPISNFEELILKNTCSSEEKIRYDINSGKDIKKKILKQIGYHKESSDLKGPSIEKTHLNVEAGSWRKKSSEASGDDGYNSKKGQKDSFNPKNSKKDKSYKGKGEYGSNDYKRKRFNSDGEVDPQKINVSDNKGITKIEHCPEIKFRYSNAVLSQIFNQLKIENGHSFVEFVDEICSKERKAKIPTFEEEIEKAKRDRSKTFNYQANDFKFGFNEQKKSINLPKNNPLQDVNNFDFSNNNNNYKGGYKNSFSKNNYNSNAYKNKFDFVN